MIKRLIKKFDQRGSRQKKVYIVPTAKGFKFIFVNFTIFLMALSYSNNMALLIAFLMVSYLIITMLETHKFIQDASIESAQITDFFLSHPNPLTLKSKNPFEERASQVLQLELITDEENIRSSQGCESADLNHKFQLMMYRRGHYKSKSLKLFTVGFTELFYVWRYFPCNIDLYIYPAKRFINLKKLSLNPEKENIVSEAEFQYHIPYSQSMSAKRIDWKVYARTDSLYWKKHLDHESLSIEINYNALSGTEEEKLEYMSFLVDKNYRDGNSWKLVLPNKVFSFNKGHNHYKTSLEELSVF